MTTPAIRFSYAVVVAFIACVVIAFSSVLYSSHVQREGFARERATRAEADQKAAELRAETDAKWCTLMVTLDEAYSGPQKPTTPLGVRVAEAVHDLRSGLKCPPG